MNKQLQYHLKLQNLVLQQIRLEQKHFQIYLAHFQQHFQQVIQIEPQT